MRHVPPRVLGSAVGGIIVLTNVRTLLRSDWLSAGETTRNVVYVLRYAIWAAAVIHSVPHPPP